MDSVWTTPAAQHIEQQEQVHKPILRDYFWWVDREGNPTKIYFKQTTYAEIA